MNDLAEILPSELTERGWPRPRNSAGLPVPWVSPRERLKQTSPERHEATIHGLLCQVCGYQHAPGSQVFLFLSDPVPEDLNGKVALAMDDAILHERCAKLTLGRCPGVGAVRDRGDLSIVFCDADDIEIVFNQNPEDDEAEKPRLSVDGHRCQPITIEEFKEAAWAE